MLYALLRQALFRIDAERAHDLSLPLLNRSAGAVALLQREIESSPVTCFGLHFNNPVGLAAGLDKNGDYLNGLARLGFGFCEIGTVTPKPQDGNPKPRLFRLPADQALINRMGFNNKGVDHLIRQVAQFDQQQPKLRANIRLGINIGKNKLTANENAVDDYIHCLRKVFLLADYVTINISSPNTPGLRDLQMGESRRELLQALRNEQLDLSAKHSKIVPMLVKIAPDMAADDISDFASDVASFSLDGVIATNTTNSADVRVALEHENAGQEGGISGQPVNQLATQTLHQLRDSLGDKVPIIAAGGIMSAENALDRFKSGATLLQVYTGLIYEGPKLIREIITAHRQSTL